LAQVIGDRDSNESVFLIRGLARLSKVGLWIMAGH